MLSIVAAFFSRNSLAIAACLGLIAWGTLAVKKHDQQVARVAVQEHKEQAREVVKKAKAAQRRVDPTSSSGMLADRYRTDF